MKRILFCVLAAVLLGATAGVATSCKGCKGKGAPAHEADYDGVKPDFTAGVANIVALHRQTMHELSGGKAFAWYETKVTLSDSVKADALDGLYVTDVTDIFQTFAPDLCQPISSNVEKGTLIPEPTPGLWVEDFDLGGSEIALWPEDVLAVLERWNGILPPATGMTLRKPVGPKPCNAQWVIGNIMQVVFVDAVTGEVSDRCPAF